MNVGIAAGTSVLAGMALGEAWFALVTAGFGVIATALSIVLVRVADR